MASGLTPSTTPEPAPQSATTVEDVVLLQQGAEGKLYVTQYFGQRCLVKERFVKAYRHPDLDRMLAHTRMRAESKAIARCHAADILVPKIFHMDLDTRRIYMQYFEHSCTVRNYIQNVLPPPAERCDKAADNRLDTLGARIGRTLAKMHQQHIIHGDLTTSNMLLTPADPKEKVVGADTAFDVVMIDFGLAHYHNGVEDKAVDLYVLERALLSTHSAVMPNIFLAVLKAYEEFGPDAYKEVYLKLEGVRARGRKRTMIG